MILRSGTTSTCIQRFLGVAYRGAAQISGVWLEQGMAIHPAVAMDALDRASPQLKLANDVGRKSIPRALGSASATPFPLVQPGLHVADAHSAASDRVDDLRWRLEAARVPRAAPPLLVEAEHTTAERRAATVMHVGDPARGRRDLHRHRLRCACSASACWSSASRSLSADRRCRTSHCNARAAALS